MRISTNQIFDAGSSSILNSQSSLYKLQNQLSSGRRVQTPQDDPVAASQALVVTQSKEVNAQYVDNQGAAKSQLGLVDSQLATLVNVLQNIRTTVVGAGNTGTYSQSDRETMATEIESRLSEIVGIANTDNGVGEYLFSGYKGNVTPFAVNTALPVSPPATTAPIDYFGDEGERLLQMSPSRQIGISVAGSDVFMTGKTGNGTFVTATGGNVGVSTGVRAPALTASAGTVTDQSLWTAALANPAAGQPLEIRFADATHYGIYDPVSGNTTGPLVYTPGSPISLVTAGGVDFSAQVTVTGTPAGGESFKISAVNGNISVSTGTTRSFTADAGTILNRTQYEAAQANPLAGEPLEIRFADSTHYGIYDPVSGLTTGPLPYTSGTAIPLVTAAGVNFSTQVVVTGTPVAGESFTIQSSVNKGTAIIDAGSVQDPQKWAQAVNNAAAGQPVEIRFASVGGVLSYGIYDPVGGLTTMKPYFAGQAIPLVTKGVGTPVDFGSQVIVQGQPAAGDTFEINPSTNQSVFQTVQNLVGMLRKPIGSSTYTKTQFSNELGAQLTNIDQSLNNISRVQSTVGTRMQEIESLGSQASDLDIQYQSTLSDLQDIDYAKAISDFMKQQMNLEAAQSSFAKITGLSLFNYL